MSDLAIPAASIRRQRIRLAAVVALLGVGALLRILLLAALPRFFVPGDPATYFQMATAILRHGIPRIDFVWNYTSFPAAVSHVESFHEFGYAYVLAGAMAIFGAKPVVGCALSVAFGILATVLTWVFARRFGPRVAWVAAAIVALEPWSIYYSGVLMKETLVSVVAILALEAMRRLMSSARSGEAVGVWSAGIVLVASALQYEMLPVLAIAAGVALVCVRRDAVPAYLLAITVVVGLAVAASLTWLGVPISGKLEFFLGRHLWTTGPHGPGTYASPTGVQRFLPLPYVLASLLVKWYVPILALAWLGSRARGVSRIELALPAAFAACYLYFHGVPHDLWQRDFIPLLPVLAPLAALGVCRTDVWGKSIGWPGSRHGVRISRGALATAVAAAGYIGVMATYTLHVQGTFQAQWLPWTLLSVTAAVGLVLLVLLYPLSFAFRLRAVRHVLPVLSLGALLAAYSQSLPWAWVYENPQYPTYAQVAREHVEAFELLAQAERGAAVMCGTPAEARLYSGHPAVLLPVTHDLAAIEALQKRYHVRYLLIRDDDLEPTLLPALMLTPIARRLGYVLYAFPGPAAERSPGRINDRSLALATGR